MKRFIRIRAAADRTNVQSKGRCKDVDGVIERAVAKLAQELNRMDVFASFISQ
jgi:hypothetical protein